MLTPPCGVGHNDASKALLEDPTIPTSIYLRQTDLVKYAKWTRYRGLFTPSSEDILPLVELGLPRVSTDTGNETID